jgi:hypothetical protein
VNASKLTCAARKKLAFDHATELTSSNAECKQSTKRGRKKKEDDSYNALAYDPKRIWVAETVGLRLIFSCNMPLKLAFRYMIVHSLVSGERV